METVKKNIISLLLITEGGKPSLSVPPRSPPSQDARHDACYYVTTSVMKKVNSIWNSYLVMEGVGWMADRDREKEANRHEDCSSQASHLSVTTEWRVPSTSRHYLVPISDSCCSLPRALIVDLTSNTVSHPTIQSPDFER